MAAITRRRVLRSATALSAASFPAFGGQMPGVPGGTVRDRFWLFTVAPGGVTDEYLELGGVRGGSRMTPAEGAYYLDVPNVILVRDQDVPKPPAFQKWRAKTSFEQYAISFRPLKRVVWSVVGSGGQMQGNEAPPVLSLAKSYPNIMGVYLDDFLLRDGKQLKGAMSPEQLRTMRGSLVASGRRLEMWLTLYVHQVNPSHRNYVPTDAPLAAYLDPFDIVLLWTWNSAEIDRLEENFAKLVEIRPRGNGLGLYLWDFQNHKPMTVPLMEKQCKLGLQWLKEGKIREVVFLSNAVLDVGLEVVEWTRNWIESVASERL